MNKTAHRNDKKTELILFIQTYDAHLHCKFQCHQCLIYLLSTLLLNSLSDLNISLFLLHFYHHNIHLVSHIHLHHYNFDSYISSCQLQQYFNSHHNTQTEIIADKVIDLSDIKFDYHTNMNNDHSAYLLQHTHLNETDF